MLLSFWYFNLSLDVWDNIASGSAGSRSAVIGSAYMASICSNNQYSIIEYAGLNSIQNAAHELGHRLVFASLLRINIDIITNIFFFFSLGAVHDQTGIASSCPASSNYIMTSSVGSYTNATNSFYFSNCSITSFKKTILTSDFKFIIIIIMNNFDVYYNIIVFRNVTKTCLLNSPVSAFAVVSGTYKYPGQFYSITRQCQLAMGL